MRIGGIAKGSGMIHPNMATLLSVITTDANVDPSLWHTILLHGVQKSFNQVCLWPSDLNCRPLTIQSDLLCRRVGSQCALVSSMWNYLHMSGGHSWLKHKRSQLCPHLLWCNLCPAGLLCTGTITAVYIVGKLHVLKYHVEGCSR